MATPTTLPTLRRVCALASPIPLASAAQLIKNPNLAETWIGADVESHDEIHASECAPRISLKRRRQAQTTTVNECRNQPARIRIASPVPPVALGKFRQGSDTPDARSSTTRSVSARDSNVSPTPRSAPLAASHPARPQIAGRTWLASSRSHPVYPSSPARLRSRPFSSTSSKAKPALAYHDLGSRTADTPAAASESGIYLKRGTATVATPAAAQPGSDELNSPNVAKPARESCLLPRPPSPYGEINELIRHPTLYDPILKPRHPIVLCHGLYGFDVRGPGFFRLHYWGDLLKILRGKIGAEVYVTAVPGTGSVKNRANVLHKSLEDTPSLLNRDINFVAHSMGGLDARYLISQIRPVLYHPRSLTSICTPHRGSEFMAWCRANIGIGTELESSDSRFSMTNSASLEEPDDASIPLPLTLKSPILSREQVEAAKKATQKAKQAAERGEKYAEVTKFPGLPFNLSTTVTSYLLNLLDSPAYANLTPAFLRDVFNPTTPNLPDVKYYSIAGRTERIPIWHPLWLPKVVLDGAEQARVSQGRAAPPEWRGNDGLVNVDSARWGEFLGTFDGADHWEMRGSSGLISAEASKSAVEEMARSEFRKTKEPVQGEKAERVQGGTEDEKYQSAPRQQEKDRGWQWQDVYALIGKLKGSSKKNGNEAKVKAIETGFAASPAGQGDGAEVQTLKAAASPVKPDSEPRTQRPDSHDAQGLASAADWIVSQLPGAGPSKQVAGQIAQKAGDIAGTVAATTAQTAVASANSVLANPATRLLYGAPVSSSNSSSSPSPKVEARKYDKFSLEDMTVALCRKLYNDGL
ncbi:esterase/lipase family protein [Sporobolomyces koalae]|uniref:esterase/lipase family protein n=1 Tax=Sporobolomyces koalae TaxID=500713 RepID=UPI003178C126